MCVPSPAHPDPGAGNYFDGGYNTRRHGSRDGGRVDAVQLEVPRHLRVGTSARRRLAEDLARGFEAFLERWYETEDAARDESAGRGRAGEGNGH